MDMKIGNRTVSGVGLVKLDKFGCYPAEDTPATRAAMAQDGLVLEDARGQEYYAHKRAMVNRDGVYAGRGDRVTIGGLALRGVHNVNKLDTRSERIGARIARFFERALFEIQVFPWRVKNAVTSLVMGAASR